MSEVVHGPACLFIYGLEIIQYDDFIWEIHGDVELISIPPYPSTGLRGKQFHDPVNELEQTPFMLIIVSLGWFGITVLQFCSVYPSHLQHKIYEPKVSHLIEQCNIFG